MQINKKILLAAFSMSFHGAVMSMEQVTFEEQQEIRKLVGNQAAHIGNFARAAEHDATHMVLLGAWLTQQRKAVTEPEKWNLLVEHLAKTVSFCGCHCVQNESTTAVKNSVIKIASELKPGQDCSQLLVQRAQEAMRNVELSRAYRIPVLGNGLGADWNPASSTCYCKI